jgi:peptidoglycan hydrolase-like protein with peptidoglycan-binding domain
MTIGATGSDVKSLQQYLNNHGFQVSLAGVGSPGNETTTFGPATTAALAKFQAANGISPAAGYFGPITMAKVNSLAGTRICTTPTTATQSPISTGSFTRDLTLGSTGSDVILLQKYLNTHGFPVATTGNGSSGHETTYFGPATQSALARYQAANGITPAAGYFGPKTRAAVGK